MALQSASAARQRPLSVSEPWPVPSLACRAVHPNSTPLRRPREKDDRAPAWCVITGRTEARALARASGRLLDLLLGLVVDGLQRIVDTTALGDGGKLREDSLIHLGGEGAVLDARDLALPIREVLPDRLVAEERIGRLVGVALDGRHPRAEGALPGEDLLVEVLVARPDGLEEVDRGVLGRSRGQHVPARAAFARVVGRAIHAHKLRNGRNAPLARLVGLRLDSAGHPDAVDGADRLARGKG